MARRCQLEANKRFRKQYLYCTTLCFHKVYDKSVIEKLISQENRTDYIRQLVLDDIKKEEK